VFKEHSLEAWATVGGDKLPLWTVPKQSLGGMWRSQVQLGNEGVKAPGGAPTCQPNNYPSKGKKLRYYPLESAERRLSALAATA
jgi:hypothetical protein